MRFTLNDLKYFSVFHANITILIASTMFLHVETGTTFYMHLIVLKVHD